METTIVATPEADVKQGSALERASKMITPPPLSSELNQIRENIKKCEAALQDLLPIEENAKSALEVKLEELKKLNAISAYPKLSLEVLKWRNKQGFPLFALFDYKTNSRFYISSAALPPTLPAHLSNYFRDVQEKLIPQAQAITTRIRQEREKKAEKGKRLKGVFVLVCVIMGIISLGGVIRWGSNDATMAITIPLSLGMIVFPLCLLIDDTNYAIKTILTIAARYTGVIPSSVRQKIQEAEKNRELESIFILAEIPEWKVQQTVLPKQDPLVLGYRDESLYLIAKYDTTPTEEYVAREFAI